MVDAMLFQTILPLFWGVHLAWFLTRVYAEYALCLLDSYYFFQVIFFSSISRLIHLGRGDLKSLVSIVGTYNLMASCGLYRHISHFSSVCLSFNSFNRS